MNIKLDYIQVRPFFKMTKKEIINYKLELSKNAKIYIIFHLLLFKFTDPKISI